MNNTDPRTKCENFVKNYNPCKIYDELRKTVFGNEETLKRVALLVYGWSRHILMNEAPHNMNFFITGVSGSGKTTLCRALQSFMPCPVLLRDATAITGHGWKGQEAEYIVDDDELYKNGGYGIVFIDEIDKRMSPEIAGDGSNFSESALNSLLRVVEGSDVTISDNRTVNTCRTLFIGTGAFETVRDRKNMPSKVKNGIGFSPETKKADAPARDSKITIEDIAGFCRSKQFVGRFIDCLSMEQPTYSTLEKIADNAVREIGRLYGHEMVLSREEKDEIIHASADGISGCRSIRSAIWQKYLMQETDSLFTKSVAGLDDTVPVPVSGAKIIKIPEDPYSNGPRYDISALKPVPAKGIDSEEIFAMPHIEKGMTVVHTHFGEGKILNIYPELKIMTVQFEAGEKRFTTDEKNNFNVFKTGLLKIKS